MLWQASGKATNLGAVLGSAWSNTVAVGINNIDDVIGYGDYNGAISGFLLIDPPGAAAPELSTWAMLVAGFAGLGFVARRRRPRAPSIA